MPADQAREWTMYECPRHGLQSLPGGCGCNEKWERLGVSLVEKSALDRVREREAEYREERDKAIDNWTAERKRREEADVALPDEIERADAAERERDERLTLDESRALAFRVDAAERRVAELEEAAYALHHLSDELLMRCDIEGPLEAVEEFEEAIDVARAALSPPEEGTDES